MQFALVAGAGGCYFNDRHYCEGRMVLSVDLDEALRRKIEYGKSLVVKDQRLVQEISVEDLKSLKKGSELMVKEPPKCEDNLDMEVEVVSEPEKVSATYTLEEGDSFPKGNASLHALKAFAEQYEIEYSEDVTATELKKTLRELFGF